VISGTSLRCGSEATGVLVIHQFTDIGRTIRCGSTPGTRRAGRP